MKKKSRLPFGLSPGFHFSVSYEITVPFLTLLLTVVAGFLWIRRRRWKSPLGAATLLFLLLTVWLCKYVIDESRYWLYHDRASGIISDFRNLAVCIEMYYLDNSTYPLPTGVSISDASAALEGGKILVGGVPWAALTTPVLYMDFPRIPRNPFGKGDDSGESYRYATDLVSAWILSQDGPNNVTDLPHRAVFQLRNTGESKSGDWPPNFVWNEYAYNPSNGILSPGDIIRGGPDGWVR